MDKREHLLSAVRISRVATAKLSVLMQEKPLDADKIRACVEKGALVEEAFHEIEDERHHHIRRIHAIDMALKEDRDDIVRLFFEAPGLDMDARKQWLHDAVSRNATQCTLALIGMGAMAHLSDAQRNELMEAALGCGNATLVKAALSAGCDPNGMVEAATERKEPLLHQVRDPGSLAVMLSAGARIDGTDTWGRPALHNVLDRLSYCMNDAKRAETAKRYIQTAHALLDAGCPIAFISKEEGERSWNAIEDLTQARACDASLLERIAKLDPKSACKANVRNIQAAHYLIDSGVIEDLDLLRKNIYWSYFSLCQESEIRAVETLLERGVPPPNVFQIGDSSHRQWLSIGIMVTEAHISRKIQQVELNEEHEIYENWSGLLEPELVEASNRNAEARALRIKTQIAGGVKSSTPRL